MLKFFAILLIAVVLAALIGDSIVQAVGWVLAFLSLLILGDLLWSQASKLVRRVRRG